MTGTPRVRPAHLAVTVPELAPSLGRLVVPRRRTDPWVPLEDVREALATDAMTLAGEARRAAAAGPAAAAVAALSADRWRDAWERAVRRAAARVAGVIDAEIEHAAWRVRMPRRRWRRRLLTGGERRAVAVRLALGGEPLGPALATLTAAGQALASVESPDAERLRDWQDAVRLAARRLEAAWLALEDAVAEERRRWAPEIAAVDGWRPPLWPVFAWWVPLAAVALWLSLVLGGYVPAPSWLAAQLGF